jgi:hypothetical protein
MGDNEKQGGNITPAVKSRDFAVDANTAMIFSDEAPLHKYVHVSTSNDPKPLDMLPKKNFPTGSDPDFDAVWTFIPDSRQNSPSTKQSAQEELSVLLYFHGFRNWVTVGDPAATVDADGVPPHWAMVGPLRPFPKPDQNRTKGPIASGPKYELNRPKKHDPIMLVPEDGVPRHDPRFDKNGNFLNYDDTNRIKNSAGSLTKDDKVDLLIDDCLKHLHSLSNTFVKPPAPYVPQISIKDVKRLFLTGHSGGGGSLALTAVSKAAKRIPTDLLLLDCTYTAVNEKYVEFCDNWKGKLGPGSGNSRMMVVWNEGSGTQPLAIDLFEKLKKDGFRAPKEQVVVTVKSVVNGKTVFTKQIREPIPIDPAQPPNWPAAKDIDMLVLNFSSKDRLFPDQKALDIIEQPLKLFKVVLVKTNIIHEDIPNVFIPLLCNTATIP